MFTDTSHNDEIDKATRLLQEGLVPDVALELLQTVSKAHNNPWEYRLTEAVHRKGVNVRYLGAIYSQLCELPATVSNEQCKAMLLVEMFARAIKHLLRKRLRTKMQQLKLPLEDPYCQLVTDYLNLVFGETPKSSAYWDKVLAKEVCVKFEGLTLPVGDGRSVKELVCKSRAESKQQLLVRVQKMMGLQFCARAEREFASGNKLEQAAPINRRDLEQIGERVKHMNIISHAEGYLLMVKGMHMRATSPAAAKALLQSAIDQFAEVLNSNTNSKVTLRNCAKALMLLHEEHLRSMPSSKELAAASTKGSKATASAAAAAAAAAAASKAAAATAASLVRRAEDYLLRAIELDPTDVQSLFSYAGFLEGVGRLTEAEEYYLKTLEINPNFVAALRHYGQLLEQRGEYQLAERLFLRSVECSK